MSKTIAAVATGPAAGPIGIIRVSGPQTLAIVDTIFTPQGGGALSERPNACFPTVPCTAETARSLTTVCAV